MGDGSGWKGRFWSNDARIAVSTTSKRRKMHFAAILQSTLQLLLPLVLVHVRRTDVPPVNTTTTAITVALTLTAIKVLL